MGQIRSLSIAISLTFLLSACTSGLSGVAETFSVYYGTKSCPSVEKGSLFVHYAGICSEFKLVAQEGLVTKYVRVWSNHEGVILREFDGRLIGIQGIKNSWLHVDWKYAPLWGQLRLHQGYERRRWVDAAQRVWLEEVVHLVPSQIPSDLKNNFQDHQLVWLKEEILEGLAEERSAAAYYGLRLNAWGQYEWLVTHQCLDAQRCLTWYSSNALQP